MESNNEQLPTAIWVEACLKPLNGRGVFYYYLQKGNYSSGVVYVKINDLDGACRFLSQERDLDGNLAWVHILGEEIIDESKIDDYIQRLSKRDPDAWIIEIEDPDGNNPFEPVSP